MQKNLLKNIKNWRNSELSKTQTQEAGSRAGRAAAGLGGLFLYFELMLDLSTISILHIMTAYTVCIQFWNWMYYVFERVCVCKRVFASVRRFVCVCILMCVYIHVCECIVCVVMCYKACVCVIKGWCGSIYLFAADVLVKLCLYHVSAGNVSLILTSFVCVVGYC